MALSGISIYVSILFVALLFSWYIVHDDVSCIVQECGQESINGFYAAIGGMYVRRGYTIFSAPDFYNICNLHKTLGQNRQVTTISLHEHSWQIFRLPAKKSLYKNTPSTPEKYIFQPPERGWEAVDPTSSYSDKPPVISNCEGSLADSPALIKDHASNIEIIMNRPVTTCILIIIFAVAYFLWANRVEVRAVSFSYETVMNGELWRIFTASLAHYELMHLGFNCMSLYQLGSLEPLWGSVAFAYLNFALVILTIAICLGITHVLVHRYGQTAMAQQHSIGYSCVLFAWMVASSVRMDRFCPIFFLPSLCFQTYFIPLPGIASNGNGLPVNIGPFILLIFTKFLLPNSSLLGHLSGIIIGYPLAWNMLDGLTPPLIGTVVLCVLIWKDRLFVWRFAGYTSYPVLSDFFVNEKQLRKYTALQWLQWLQWLSVPMCIYCYGFNDIPLRCVLSFLVWSAVHARRCVWLTDVRDTHYDCALLILLAAATFGLAAVNDVLSLGASFGAWQLIITSGGLSVNDIYLATLTLVIAVTTEVAMSITLVLCLQDMPIAQPWLSTLRMDSKAVEQDIGRMGVGVVSLVATPRPFGGQARVLSVSSTQHHHVNDLEEEGDMDGDGDGDNAPLIAITSRYPAANAAAAHAAMARLGVQSTSASTGSLERGKKPSMSI
eukprot:gene8225-16910_t